MIFLPTCWLCFFLYPLSRYPGVPADIQEENGIQYKFEVYEKAVLAQ